MPPCLQLWLDMEVSLIKWKLNYEENDKEFWEVHKDIHIKIWPIL